jgi:transcriptional regulator with XRE-family HTH domain
VTSSRSTADDAVWANKQLVERLSERRRQFQITQAEMAKLLKRRNQSEVAKIESGERALRLQDLVRWARAVGENPGDLLVQFEEDLKSRPRVRLKDPR